MVVNCCCNPRIQNGMCSITNSTQPDHEQRGLKISTFSYTIIQLASNFTTNSTKTYTKMTHPAAAKTRRANRNLTGEDAMRGSEIPLRQLHSFEQESCRSQHRQRQPPHQTNVEERSPEFAKIERFSRRLSTKIRGKGERVEMVLV